MMRTVDGAIPLRPGMWSSDTRPPDDGLRAAVEELAAEVRALREALPPRWVLRNGLWVRVPGKEG